MARNDEHQSISDVLKNFVDKNKLQKGLDRVNVKEVWQAQMGPAINKYTTSIQLDTFKFLRLIGRYCFAR